MHMTTSTSSTRFALDPIHDDRHALSNAPLARESLVFMLPQAAEGVAAFVYTWVTGESKAGAALCVYGPAIGPEAIFEIVDGIEVPRSMGFDDWRVGGLNVRHGKRLQTADLTFVGKRASLDHHFQAMHPAYNYGSHADGCPSFLADDRFEQSGRVKGVLRFDGRSLPFETFGHRDHSWGTRDWGVAQHWKWLISQAAPDLSVHFFEIEAVGRNILRGYVWRDGRIAAVTGVDVSYTDAALEPTSIDALVADELGRKTRVRGTTFALFEFKVSPLATLLEASLSLEIEGRPGVGHVELHWPKDYLAYMRQRAR
jgi:hypothetical protein